MDAGVEAAIRGAPEAGTWEQWAAGHPSLAHDPRYYLISFSNLRRLLRWFYDRRRDCPLPPLSPIIKLLWLMFSPVRFRVANSEDFVSFERG